MSGSSRPPPPPLPHAHAHTHPQAYAHPHPQPHSPPPHDSHDLPYALPPRTLYGALAPHALPPAHLAGGAFGPLLDLASSSLAPLPTLSSPFPALALHTPALHVCATLLPRLLRPPRPAPGSRAAAALRASVLLAAARGPARPDGARHPSPREQTALNFAARAAAVPPAVSVRDRTALHLAFAPPAVQAVALAAAFAGFYATITGLLGLDDDGALSGPRAENVRASLNLSHVLDDDEPASAREPYGRLASYDRAAGGAPPPCPDRRDGRGARSRRPRTRTRRRRWFGGSEDPLVEPDPQMSLSNVNSPSASYHSAHSRRSSGSSGPRSRSNVTDPTSVPGAASASNGASLKKGPRGMLGTSLRNMASARALRNTEAYWLTRVPSTLEDQDEFLYRMCGFVPEYTRQIRTADDRRAFLYAISFLCESGEQGHVTAPTRHLMCYILAQAAESPSLAAHACFLAVRYGADLVHIQAAADFQLLLDARAEYARIRMKRRVAKNMASSTVTSASSAPLPAELEFLGEYDVVCDGDDDDELAVGAMRVAADDEDDEDDEEAEQLVEDEDREQQDTYFGRISSRSSACDESDLPCPPALHGFGGVLPSMPVVSRFRDRENTMEPRSVSSPHMPVSRTVSLPIDQQWDRLGVIGTGPSSEAPARRRCEDSLVSSTPNGTCVSDTGMCSSVLESPSHTQHRHVAYRDRTCSEDRVDEDVVHEPHRKHPAAIRSMSFCNGSAHASLAGAQPPRMQPVPSTRGPDDDDFVPVPVIHGLDGGVPTSPDPPMSPPPPLSPPNAPLSPPSPNGTFSVHDEDGIDILRDESGYPKQRSSVRKNRAEVRAVMALFSERDVALLTLAHQAARSAKRSTRSCPEGIGRMSIGPADVVALAEVLSPSAICEGVTIIAVHVMLQRWTAMYPYRSGALENVVRRFVQGPVGHELGLSSVGQREVRGPVRHFGGPPPSSSAAILSDRRDIPRRMLSSL